MNDAFVNFQNNLITKKHLSFYNKNDIEILNEYRTVVPIGILEEIVPELIELDIKKAFTYALTLIKEIPLFNEFDIKKTEVFAKRERIFTKEVEVTNNKIKLEFYDNGAIDNDSISVFVNNKIVIQKSKLDYAPIKLDIKLDESLPYNEISMFAENLGQIPPNTALLVIYDGNKRYDILLTSDFTKNATIKLISKKR